MIVGQVSGEVFMTIKHPAYDKQKLLIIDRLDQKGEPDGGYLIAVDMAGAGVGQKVLVLDEGNGARQILEYDDAPIRSIVVGIVDEVALTS